MGVDVVGIVGHRLTTEEILDLPTLLNSVQGAALAEALDLPWAPGTRKPWSLEYVPTMLGNPNAVWPDTFPITVDGHGLQLHMSPHVCDFMSGMRWPTFLTSAPHRRAQRRIAFQLARLLDADGALWVPDSTYRISLVTDLVDEARSLDDLTTWLRAEYGPPEEHPVAALEEAAPVVSGADLAARSDTYFWDSFDDLDPLA